MAKDMTLLWGSGSPPCWRIMIVLEEKKLQGYNSKLMSFEKQDHKGPEVMAINPRGQFPAFKHGDIIINESTAVCLYLADRFKDQGTALVPDCPAEKAVMLQRMFEINALHSKFLEIILYNHKFPENERCDAAIQRNKEAMTAELKIWEEHLKECKGKYLAGKDFSLADAVVFPFIAIVIRMGVCEQKYPNIAKYYNHLKTRPSIKETWPPTWTEPTGQPILKDV